ncbi:dioxygenase [Microbacterium deminutum]|uniref:Dioxygenase n=1 Tax=Microbacterium deminutum TaxID=344164 RepID=A0ABP5BR42_9MICO
MASAGKDRGSREARERTRVYRARQAYREGQNRRRNRDNLLAGIAGGLLILGVVAAQTAYFVAGPGAPEPTPSSTPIPTVTSTPTPTGSPTPTPTP